VYQATDFTDSMLLRVVDARYCLVRSEKQ